MKFSKQTIDILKNFSQINSSIMLTKGSFIMTKSLNSVVYAEAQIPDVIDEDVGIYDLNSFLNMLNIVGVESDIQHDISTGEIIIRGDKTKIVERSADPTTIAKPKKRLEMPVADLVFQITSNDFEKLIKASRMMKLTNLSVSPINGKLVMTANSKESASTFSVEVGEYEGDNVFNFDMKVDNLLFINSDYKVEISSKGAAKFSSENGVSYVVVLESTSKFQ
ncbi:sliding clamp DNA polymerase [Yersinia phage JC221]|nr:sliding clamp DNA polymerase [Yersinia phage JC221]